MVLLEDTENTAGYDTPPATLLFQTDTQQRPDSPHNTETAFREFISSKAETNKRYRRLQRPSAVTTLLKVVTHA